MRFPVIFLPLIILSACGSGDERTVTVPDGEGGEAQITTSTDGGDGGTFKAETDEGTMVATTGDKASGKLPYGLSVYPGAKVTMDVQGSDKGTGNSGSMVSFSTDASPQKVMEHYRGFAAANGFATEGEATIDKMMTFGAKKPTGEAFTVTAQPDPAQQGGATQVMIMAGMGG